MPDILQRRPERGHIIIVDDNEEVRHSVSLMLRARGYRADSYASGEDMLDNVDGRVPTCYLIDYKLPRYNGVDLLQEMRARGIDAPALMITGYYSPGLRQKALDVGYGDVIEKPLPREELLAQIATIKQT